jgi:NAD(P)H-nitrite reductase large subunit
MDADPYKINTCALYMNDIDPVKKQDVVCHCSGTTKGQIKELVNNGIDNLDRISRMTGACSGCGACDASILELLAEYTADYGV